MKKEKGVDFIKEEEDKTKNHNILTKKMYPKSR